MATVTYTNFLAVNPPFQNILDSTPAIGVHDATTFEMINNNLGSTNGFVFRLTGTGFTYSGTTPTGGTITGGTVLDNAAHVIATIDGPVGEPSLTAFFSGLTFFGPVAAR